MPEKGFQQIVLKQDVDSTLKYGHRVFIFPSRNTVNASENKDFIPALQKEYGARMKLVQKELAVMYEIK